MERKKTRVFMTGATGVMGSAGLRELMKYPETYKLSVLARDSRRNRRKLQDFETKGGKVIWGDLLDEQKLREGINNADIVLHVGGMVSPMAEHFPEKTLEINIGSMELIAAIVKDIENKEPQRTVKVVYIGSVSQYGSHLPPQHWGKVGDKLESAKFDAYAVSKIMAERALVAAGIKRWVSIRQTGILHPGMLMKASDPVTFHVPVNGVIEWISVEDSGRLLERVCRDDVPDTFWNNYYNAGGGAKLRLTNLEFERGILKAMGCPPPEKVFEPGWFALDNFHGIWFEDSDYLEDILHFRSNESFEEILRKMKGQLPFYFKLTPIVPAPFIKFFMKRVASKPGLGPLSWLKNNEIDRINIAWGNRQNHSKISGWKDFEIVKPDRREGTVNKSLNTGSCELRQERCSKGHYYWISDALKAGGHGCPDCLFDDAKVERAEK